MANEKKTPMQYWDRKLKTLAPSTQTEYRRQLNVFLEWANLTPKSLYDKTKDALNATDKRDSNEVQELAQDYIDHLEGLGRAPSTTNQFVKALVSFLNAANKLDFDPSPLWADKRYRGSKKISKDQLLEIYRYCQRAHKLRNRALVLFLKDSGIRIGDAIALDVGDYKNAEKYNYEGDQFLSFEPLETMKTAEDAYICLGSESIDALNDYLKERGNPPHDAPLFVDDEGKRLTRGAATMQFQRLRKTLKNGKKISAHSLRKFFTTSLQSGGMELEFIHCLNGKTRSPYTRPYDDDTLRTEYAQSYSHLRIFPYSQTQRDVQTIADENKALMERLAKLEKMIELGWKYQAPVAPSQEAFNQQLIDLATKNPDAIFEDVTINGQRVTLTGREYLKALNK